MMSIFDEGLVPVTAYLFIDGGFLESLIFKAEKEYGVKLPRSKLDYLEITQGFEKTFYYDALPSQRRDETEEDFMSRLADKLKLFDRINRTPYMHTREGITRRARKLEQKGVDILMAIDVLKHTSLRNISKAHVMTTDLDFFPLFEALRDTQISVHLHCFPSETSSELMFLADTVTPITPYTILKWYECPDRDKFVETGSVEEMTTSKIHKEGTCAGRPYFIYEEKTESGKRFCGRSMAINSHQVGRSAQWQHIVWQFEDQHLHPVYFEPS
jgi:uncharacterized LabA/DUF88 family protein